MTKLTYTRNEVEELMQLEATFERERIIKLLESKQLGCPCGCHNWMEPWALIALIKGENK